MWRLLFLCASTIILVKAAHGYNVEFVCRTAEGALGGCFPSCADAEELGEFLTVSESDGKRAKPCRKEHVCCLLRMAKSQPIGIIKNADPAELNSAGCGQEFGRKFRIVNGERAPEGSHPWLLGLFMGYNFICGGSLITNRYVLSAAHCFEYGAQRYSALMGANDLTDKTKRIARRICRIAIHSNYESVNYHNDIAIAELHEPVDISGKWIRSICLPPSTQQPDDISGRQFTAAGWGSTQNELSKAATRLLEIQITAISDSACENQYRNIIQIDSSIQICAGDPEFNAKDTCQGDSGGPLIHRGSDSRYRVEGITSFGVGCAGEGSPLGGYTRVAPFVDWISMVVNDMKASAKTRPLVLFDDTTQLKNKADRPKHNLAQHN